MYYLIIATFCFSLSFGLIKNQLSVLPSDTVVFWRLLIATLVFLPFIRNIKDKKHWIALGIGVIQFGVMYFAFIKSFKIFQGNEIAVLTTSTPVFVAIWSVLFGEKFKLSYIFYIGLAVAGALVIVWKNVPLTLAIEGILLMETANCSFALGQVLWRKYIGKNSVEYMASAYSGAVIFAIPFVLVSGNLATPLTTGQILAVLYLGIIPTGLGFWLWNKGAAFVNSSTLAIMNNLKIPLGVLFAIIFFQEKINFLNYAFGASLILLAMYLSQKNAK